MQKNEISAQAPASAMPETSAGYRLRDKLIRENPALAGKVFVLPARKPLDAPNE